VFNVLSKQLVMTTEVLKLLSIFLQIKENINDTMCTMCCWFKRALFWRVKLLRSRLRRSRSKYILVHRL